MKKKLLIPALLTALFALLLTYCDRYTVTGTLDIYFLDVGQADAALVLCDNDSMLIDGGNVGDSQLIYSTLQSHNLHHLNYIVCTHAHEDHVGGLAASLNFATVDTAYCPVTSYDSKVFDNFVKYLELQGKEITVPKAGDRFRVGEADIQIIGPVEMDPADTNNTSIVMRFEYGNTSAANHPLLIRSYVQLCHGTP